jgi:outer membrane protein assembly factor BamB
MVMMALLGLCAANGAVLAQAPTNWPEFRRDGYNSGYLPGKLSATWELRTAGPVRAISYSNGVLVAGTDRTGDVLGIDAATGKTRWHAKLPSSIHNDVVIVGNLAIATFGDLPVESSPGGAVALDLLNGRIIWRFDVRGALMPSAAVYHGVAILAASDDCVYGVAVATGHLRWRTCIGMSAAMSSPKLAAGNVYFGTTDGHVVALDAASGKLRWIRRYPRVQHTGDATPAIDSSALYITGTEWYGVRPYIHDTTFGVGLRAAVHAFATQPFAQRNAFFATQRVLRIRLADGALDWSRRVGQGEAVSRNQSGTAAVSGGLVISTSPVGRTVSALAVASGGIRWSHVLDGRARGAVLVSENLVFVATENGSLTAFDLESGKQFGRCSWPGHATPTAPVLIGNAFIFASDDAVLRAISYAVLLHRLRVGHSCVT